MSTILLRGTATSSQILKNLYSFDPGFMMKVLVRFETDTTCGTYSVVKFGPTLKIKNNESFQFNHILLDTNCFSVNPIHFS